MDVNEEQDATKIDSNTQTEVDSNPDANKNWSQG